MRSRQVSLLNPLSIKADNVDSETNIRKYLESASCVIAILSTALLRAAGVPATLHIYPEGGHGWVDHEDFPYRQAWMIGLPL